MKSDKYIAKHENEEDSKVNRDGGEANVQSRADYRLGWLWEALNTGRCTLTQAVVLASFPSCRGGIL